MMGSEKAREEDFPLPYHISCSRAARVARHEEDWKTTGEESASAPFSISLPYLGERVCYDS